jgi:hypothetical protein
MRKLILLALAAAAVAWYLRNEGEQPAASFVPPAGAPPAEPATQGTGGVIANDATAVTSESDALTPDSVDPGDEAAGATEDEGR